MNNSQYIQTLCTNIHTLRQREGLSAETMANRLGIHIDLLTQLENGILPEELTVEALVRIEQAFGVSLKDIFLPL